MQGMPAKLLTQTAVKPAVKGDMKSSAVVNGKVATEGTPELQGEVSKSESKGSFADFFSGLLGNEKEIEGKGEKVNLVPADMAKEVKTQVSQESKLDALLKIKGQEQGTDKNNDKAAMTTDKALSAEVLQNINNLLVSTPADEQSGQAVVGDKISSASSNLEALLKSLKGDKVSAPGEAIIEETKETKNVKSSPLDFLLKTSKETDVGSLEKNSLLNTNPEMMSKLGLSSEDFVSHMNAKGDKAENNPLNLDGQAIDPKELLNKQMNASMKSYGQKQNLLDNGLIKNTNDLAFGDRKVKASSDELKSPDMKISADLAQIKEPFIQPMNQKNADQQNPQMDTGNAGKVLDISKMDTANHTEIIKRISDYIQQGQVANSSSLDLTVKHDSLGQFKIQVNKPMDPRSNQMDMQITTSTPEGHDFFVKNEIGLMKNLNQAGIQLSDLRIVSGGEASSFAQNDSRQSGNNNQFNQGPKEQMSFDSGDSRNGSDRRRELWQEARANQQRYGA